MAWYGINEKRNIFGLLVLLCLLVLSSRSLIANAAEDQEDYSGICSLGPADPLLVASAYPDYQLVKGPYYEITETASIDATHLVKIHTESCSDSVRTTFRFQVREPKIKAHDIDEWARYARAQILKLHMKESMTASSPEFMSFLLALPAHAPAITSLV